jgi:hypothetical protein
MAFLSTSTPVSFAAPDAGGAAQARLVETIQIRAAAPVSLLRTGSSSRKRKLFIESEAGAPERRLVRSL